MKDKKVVLQALLCLVLVVSPILSASVAGASSAAAQVTDYRSAVFSVKDDQNSLSGEGYHQMLPETEGYSEPPPMVIDTSKQYIATIETAKGDVVLKLFAGGVPVTVNNFVFLAREGFYDGLTFHRVIPGFVAQGGCPVGDGTGGPGYRFDDEFTEHTHVTGALSMANSGPDTNGSQFFITYAPQHHLDGVHTVFGQLIEGMDVLESIEQGEVMIRITIATLDAPNGQVTPMVAAGAAHTVGLRSDGTVSAVGWNDYGQCDVGDWKDIVQVAAGWGHTVGLKADGTVVATGWGDEGQCDVHDWTDIVQIAAGTGHTVGLKENGTVVAVGWNEYGHCNTDDWVGIIQIAAAFSHTVGLKSDRTVVAVGANWWGETEVDGWTDIAQVAAGGAPDFGVAHTLGLKLDGTAVATGGNLYGELEVDGWTDIVQVAAGTYHTMGVKQDGTVVGAGGNWWGELDIDAWTDIVQVAAGYCHSVGLKADCTVVATGDDSEGQCNVTGWNLCETSSRVTDSFADLGNLDDEAVHNLVGWGDAQGPPENPFVSPSGDRTKRYMLLRGDNSLDLAIPQTGVPHLLITEVEDGHCTDNFEIYVNSQGPLYSYTGANVGTGNIAVIRHHVLIPQAYITGPLVTITFRNTATDDCGLAAVYNVGLQRAAQDEARFVADVTIPDGTMVQPGEEFVKTWRLRNTGATTWTTDYRLICDGGDLMGAPHHVNLDAPVPPNATVDISVPMTAPLSGGAKRGYWRMENPAGLRFGHTVWVEIYVRYAPGSELQDAIDNLYNTTMQRLELLKQNVETTAGHGDFFCAQADAAKLEGGLKVALGFASMAGDIQDIRRLRQGVQLVLPGMEAGWEDIWRLKQHYASAGFLFDTKWQHFVETGTFSGLGPEILSGGLKFYAAAGLEEFAENLGVEGVMVFYEWLAGRQDGFSEILYPAFVSAAEMAQEDLTDRRNQLLSSLPSLSPEEQATYAADLHSRTQAARNLYLASTYMDVNLSSIRGFYEDEGWTTKLGLMFLKWLARGLANATFDGLGKLLVDGFLTAHDAYVSKFRYEEATQMAQLAQGLMVRGIETSTQLHLNASRGLDRVGDGAPTRTVAGRIENIAHYSEGYNPWWNPFTSWVETDSYTTVSITNDSADTEPATFYIVALYLTDYKAIYGMQTLLANVEHSDAVDITPGNTVEVRLEYRDASSGSSPTKDGLMFIYVYGENGSGKFAVETQATYWIPELVSQATGQAVVSTAVTGVGGGIEIIDNPVSVFLSASPEDLTYEVQTWVVNPVEDSVTATIVQDLSVDWEVLSAPGAQSSNSTQLVWELEEGGLACVTFTFAYNGDLSLDIVVPSPVVILETPDGAFLGELIGNSPSLKPILPVTGSVTMPVQVLPGDQAAVSVALQNLSTETIDGDVIVSVIPSTGSSAYNETQTFSLASSANATLDYLLPAFSEKGLYQVLTEISHGGVTRVLWRDVLRVGTLALAVSLNGTPADRVYPGDTITYSVSLSNTSGFTLNNVTVQAAVPAETLAHDVSDDGQLEGSVVEWRLPDSLPPGGTVVLSFQATVMPDVIGPEEARNIKSSATATSNEALPVGSNEVRTLLVANPAGVMGAILGDVDLHGQMDNSGVLVTVNGTYVTTTASDGSFSIDVPAGTQNVTFTYPGFHTAVYEDVTVVAGEEVHLLSVVLTPVVVDIQLSLKAGWNLVSVPVIPADPSVAAVFAGTEVVYAWNATAAGYYMPTEVEPHRGYWVAVMTDTIITVSGVPVHSWTAEMTGGWNLIGSVSESVDFSTPHTKPAGKVEAFSYRWDPDLPGYILSETIEPEMGHWIAATDACVLTLAAQED